MKVPHCRAALFALPVALAASAVLLLGMDANLTFIADDWELLVVRRGSSPSVFLNPFHEHIVIGPAVIFKVLLAIFGMGSALPFYVVSISLFLASAGLLFVYVRRRVGEWLALIGAVLILFLGAAFEDLLWAFQMGFFGSMAAGLGMLLALDRCEERGDRIACALLAVSLAFSTLGLAFAAGALTDLALGRRPRMRRAYVALGPIALYALWWLGWGHTAQSHFSLHNLETLPGYLFSAAGAGVTSLLGLASGNGSEPSQPHLIWGKLLLVVAIALSAVRIVQQSRVPRGLAVVLGIALAFWVFAGLNRTPERFPTSSRYQYPSAVFLLLLAAETLRGVRVPMRAVAAAAVVTAAALVGGISLLHRKYADHWKPVAHSLRADLAAIEIAAPNLRPGFRITISSSISVPARSYLAAVRDYGSPAFSEIELAARPRDERAAADLTMARALGLALTPPDRSQSAESCRTLQASAPAHTRINLRDAGFTLTNDAGAPVEVLLSRFANGFSVNLGSLPASKRAWLRIPVDRSSRPWSLGLRGEGAARLCAWKRDRP